MPSLQTRLLSGLAALLPAVALAATAEEPEPAVDFAVPSGTYRVFENSEGGDLGTLAFAGTPPDATTEDPAAVTSSWLGQGELTELETGWVATFDVGVTVELFLTGVAHSAHYEFTAPGLGLEGALVPVASTVGLVAPQDPPSAGPFRVSGGKRDDGGVEFWVGVPWFLQPWFQVEFVQTYVVTVEYLYYDADDELVLGNPVPGGTKQDGLDSNGGGNATDDQKGDGAGTIKIDGSTVYVDSADPGVRGYVQGGGKGSTSPSGFRMSDNPNLGPTQEMVNDFLTNPGPLPAGAIRPAGFRYTVDFTTYALINGIVGYVWRWQYSCDFHLQQATGQAPFEPECTDPVGTPTDEMDADDKAAVENYEGGGFAGEPVQ